MENDYPFDELKGLAAKKLGVDAQMLDVDKPLEEFGIDSLGLADLLFTIEDHFSIVLPDIQPGQVKTLTELALWINPALPRKAA